MNYDSINDRMADREADRIGEWDEAVSWYEECGDLDQHEAEWESERERYFQMRDDLRRQLDALDDEAHIHGYDKKRYMDTYRYEDAVEAIIEQWKSGDDQ